MSEDKNSKQVNCKMFKAARLAKIKELLIDRNQVDVQTLSALLDVSSVTIRNDLEALEKQGYLRRTHGGAVLNDSYIQERELSAMPAGNKPEYDKSRDDIAQIAAQIVTEDEWVFLGPGTTCGYIAKHLAARGHFNIITNNLYVATSVPTNTASNIILTGGVLDIKRGDLSGEMLDSSLKNIHVGKVFFSVSGIDMSGYSVSTYSEKSLFFMLKGICNQMIIVADYRKFDKLSFLRIGDLSMAKTLISNENIPETYKAYFFENNVQLFTSYDLKPSFVQKIT